MKKYFLGFLSLIVASGACAQVTLTGTSYSQNFDAIASGLPAGWSVDTSATAASAGTDAILNTGAVSWSNTTGGFKNFASGTGLTASTIAATQATATNRALGVRQTSTGHTDPGAAFVFKITNTTGKTGFAASFSLQSLDSTSARATVWAVDYGVGTLPTIFTPATTVGNMQTGDSTFSTTNITVNFNGAIDNISQEVWIRVVALTASTGTNNRASTAIDDFNLTWNNTVATPGINESGALTNFGTVLVGTSSASQSFSVSGTTLTPAAGNITVTAPTNFEVSADNSSFSNSYTIPYTGSALAATTVYARFSPTVVGALAGNIILTGGGSSAVNVPVAGTGIVAADTVHFRIMQYNLLDYGDFGSSGANVTANKDPHYRDIVQYVQPDIIGNNEVGNNTAYPQHIVDSVLGPEWDHGAFINTNNEGLINMLFWKKSMFGLASEVSICQNLRDIIAFKLYYKDGITVPHDTVFLTVIVGHLHASDDSTDASLRALETQQVASYLNGLGTGGNYIFQGDFNLYNSTEAAYQNVVGNTNTNARLNDPLNMPGDWSNHAAFAGIQTQSTRTVALGDGGVTGGLDDRFDFQLVSDYIMNGTGGIKYTPSTYSVVGQDGLHMNDSLTAAPTNTTVPANILQDLYHMSDHLPVRADYTLIPPVAPVSVAAVTKSYDIKVVNPTSNDLKIFFDRQLAGQKVNIRMYSIQGAVQYATTTTIDANNLYRQFDLNSKLPTGMYYVTITTDRGFTYTAKVIKQ